ncbi:MAG: OmpA family protein [Tenacibaculum sp.]|nr:OmpA family protein [Tenacibaculum sp.]
MKRIILIVLLIITLLGGAFLQNLLCCKPKMEVTNQSNTVKTGKQEFTFLNGLVFKSPSMNLSCQENFNFKENELNFLKPLNPNVGKITDDLKVKLEKNPNQKVVITGYCTSTEPKSPLFPNLGFDRANEVKKYFISKGISSKSLDIDGIIDDKMTLQNGIYYGPITCAVSETKSEYDWDLLKKEINADPIVVYFKTNSDRIDLNDMERLKVAKINKYINNVDGAELLVVGHTDNSGSRKLNMNLSKRRATFISNFFSKNTGIPSKRITVKGKGPDSPIASNNTTEGKAKNRRTVVKIK